MEPKAIVGLGEALWDVFPERKALGGAPANFARCVSQLGFKGCLVSAVGKDLLGKEILETLTEKKMNFLIETVDYPTGIAQVHLNAEGVAQYEICKNSAWDNIPFTKRMEDLALKCSAVCFGTLAQRNAASRNAIRSFLELVPKEAYKIFDVNLRQNFYSKEIVLQSLQYCNILKMNEEEVAEIARIFEIAGMTEREICLHLLKAYNLKFVIETKGAVGSYVFCDYETSYLEALKVPVTDTVGAGDSFIAAFAVALLRGETLQEAHKLAVKSAARTCSQRNAQNIPPLLH
ncbi:MAG: carbohydrate kinase [Fibromonadaceae bacterium]|jgi:fructokinase|nr:carbohydrate kinase [Fibromonadaceae bacterium]